MTHISIDSIVSHAEGAQKGAQWLTELINHGIVVKHIKALLRCRDNSKIQSTPATI